MMRERLIGLLKECDKLENKAIYGENGSLDFDKWVEIYADFLIERSVIVLPCKVGDTVYYVGYLPCHHGETKPDDYSCSGCVDRCDIGYAVKSKTVPSLQFIINELMDQKGIRTYYLTKEEAEAERERLNNK